MPNRIPKEVIDNILERVDIVDVIESHLPLKKTGNNFTRRCPFHEEKTPSFSVNRKQQFYHCFGCKASGNAISFLMEYLGLDFITAIKELASSCNVKIPEGGSFSNLPNQSRLIETLNFAKTFYEQQLRKSQSRQDAISYLKGRGISGKSAKEFNLGYAPPGWDNLIEAHRSKGLTDSNLLECGLVAEGKNNIYDRLRERIVFPIKNRRGSVIGFGGRALGDQQPKYLNSPETELFHKGLELYGLYESLRASKPIEIIVVEGYLDVVSLHQHGLTNTVATLGTAITKVQLEKLFRETTRIVFSFDGDKAGYNAARKSLELSLPLLKSDRQVKFSFLPEGNDPDSLIREVGARDFFNHCNTISPGEFLLSTIKKELNSEANNAEAAFVAKAKPYILSIPDSAQRVPIMKSLAEATGFDETILWKEFHPEKRKNNGTGLRSRLSEFSARPLIDQLSAILLCYPAISQKLDEGTSSLLQKEIKNCDFFLEVWEQAKSGNLNQAILFERMRRLAHLNKVKELLSIALPFSDVEATKEFKDGIQKLKEKSQQNIIKRFSHLPPSEWTDEQKQLVREYKSGNLRKNGFDQ